jgi:bifunctional non-homologous end joining protein LigD
MPSTFCTSTASTHAPRRSWSASASCNRSLPKARLRRRYVIYSEHFEDGAALYDRACDMEIEGVVSKGADAPYRSERTDDWIKVKCWKRGRYVVVGFVPGAGGISALRLGRREGTELIYAGKVGTGLHRKSAAEVRRHLEPLVVKRSPLTTPIQKPSTLWVEPKLEVEVAYGHITHDGLVRHPSFRCKPFELRAV